jgi:hypothetical protein
MSRTDAPFGGARGDVLTMTVEQRRTTCALRPLGKRACANELAHSPMIKVLRDRSL